MYTNANVNTQTHTQTYTYKHIRRRSDVYLSWILSPIYRCNWLFLWLLLRSNRQTAFDIWYTNCKAFDNLAFVNNTSYVTGIVFLKSDSCIFTYFIDCKITFSCLRVWVRVCMFGWYFFTCVRKRVHICTYQCVHHMCLYWATSINERYYLIKFTTEHFLIAIFISAQDSYYLSQWIGHEVPWTSN